MASKVLPIFFLFICSEVMAQVNTDTLYTMPIQIARALVGDAMRLRVMDSINQEMQRQLYMSSKAYTALQMDIGKMRANFEDQISKRNESNQYLVTKNEALTKSVVKARRAVKGWKIGTVLGFGVGLYLGIQAAKNN